MASFRRLRLDELANEWAQGRDTPFQIALVGVFDAAPFLADDGTLEIHRVRDELVRRVWRVPELTQRVVWTRFGEGRPLWAADPSFDPQRHIESTTLPAGADFVEWCADRLVRPLDKHRPLWRIEVVDGLPENRCALIVVLHHLMADGLTGVAIASSLLDTSPEVRISDRALHAVAQLPDRRSLVADNLSTRARSVAALVRRVPALPARTRRRWRQVQDASRDFRTRAPVTSLSIPVGPRRRLAVVKASVDELQATAHAIGVTINDLLLAAVTEGLRQLLLARGDDLAGVELRTSVPVGAREKGQPTGILVVGLPVGEPDALRRLAMIRQQTMTLKTRLRAGGGDVLDVLLLPAAAARLAVRWMRRTADRQINLFVTNVPGPTQPLWLAGAQLLEAWPVAPLVANVPLAVTALSYVNALYVSLNADASVRDLAVLAEGMQRSLRDLFTAAHKGAELPVLEETLRSIPGVVENCIAIRCSPSEVFGYVANPEHELEWNAQLTAVEKLTGGPIGTGTRYRMRFRRGVGDSLVEYVRFDPPRSWASRSTSRRLDVRFEGEVTPMESGSRLVVRTLLVPKGTLRPLRPALRSFMRRQWNHHLAAIEARLVG
jgi:diacylglycerol O-acyltransferase / wax synthase